MCIGRVDGIGSEEIDGKEFFFFLIFLSGSRGLWGFVLFWIQLSLQVAAKRLGVLSMVSDRRTDYTKHQLVRRHPPAGDFSAFDYLPLLP